MQMWLSDCLPFCSCKVYWKNWVTTLQTLKLLEFFTLVKSDWSKNTLCAVVETFFWWRLHLLFVWRTFYHFLIRHLLILRHSVQSSSSAPFVLTDNGKHALWISSCSACYDWRGRCGSGKLCRNGCMKTGGCSLAWTFAFFLLSSVEEFFFSAPLIVGNLVLWGFSTCSDQRWRTGGLLDW